MIPINLTLRNFMSYGDEPTTLPFEGLHVACLSPATTAMANPPLLDAMTWALWGRTRASAVSSVSDDDLIRVGASEMEVRFEFELNAQQYRVVKKRKKGKSSGADWQLAQKNSGGDYVPVGGSMREVGKQIIQVLSMEYETFLNSAYLQQQGRADEFTRQRPNDRKRILAEILGLSRYDRLEEKAKERQKQSKETADELDHEMRLLTSQAAELEAHQTRLTETCSLLTALETQIQAQEQTTSALRDRRSQLQSIAQLAAEADAQTLRLTTELQQRTREHTAKLARLKTMQDTLAQRDSVLGDYERLQSLRQKREKLDPEVERFNKILADLNSVVGAMDIVRVKLENAIALQARQVQEVERRRNEAARLDAQAKTLQGELQSEGKIAAELAVAQTEWQEAQDGFTELRGRNERLKQDVRDVDEVLEMLALPRAACPVCESDLSGTRHAAVLAKQERKKEGFLAEQERLKRDGAAAKQALTLAQEAVQRLEACRHELTGKRAQCNQVAARQQELHEQGTDAHAAQTQLDGLRQQLERGEFAGPERARRTKLEKEIELLKLVKAEHEHVITQIRTLDGAEKRYHQYQEVAGNWEAEFQDSERLAKALADTNRERDLAQTKSDKHRVDAAQYETVKAQAAVAEAEFSRLQDSRGLLLGEEKSLRNYIAGCERAKSELKAKRQQHDKASEERKMYTALVQAFGKKGIQTYIIENALPELEEEANALLARMTDNAMHVNFETTRAAKSGSNEIETLDIKITDDAGTRPYELFSGGEGFRVNFAIRIALSRLLARRSGAKLETLIMDEGFGSQDGKGREKLIEVIESIKEDFKKILVITHFEEMKDAFTQRIEIVKDAQGSRIHLL